MLTLSGVGLRQSSWRPVGEILLLAAAWLLANGPVEGPVLWTPMRQHGLTLADLVAGPAVVIALMVAVQRAGA